MSDNTIDDVTELEAKFWSSLIENMQDLPPEFSESVDKHFWDLAQDTPKGDHIGGHELYVRGDR